MRVLVVNAGSSSLKLRLLADNNETINKADLPTPSGHVNKHKLLEALDQFEEADAVGHRVVHGGEKFSSAVVIDEHVLTHLHDLVELAPLHQPAALSAIKIVNHARPALPAVACFDTAFHASLPPAAQTYALPSEWRKRWPIRRYGFHGLSHAYAARRTTDMLDNPDARIVVCHLGAGASLAAVHHGKSRDTTMGFTPTEGLVMATRSGNVDPGLVLWLSERLSIDEVSHALEHKSGLLGLAGTADMVELLKRRDAGDDQANAAFDIYIHRLRASIAAMTASLGGIDALTFTGGVGEKSAMVRRVTTERLDFLGIAIDHDSNDIATIDTNITSDTAAVQTVVITAREDIEIYQQVRAVTDSAPVLPPY